MGFFSKIFQGLKKTKDGIGNVIYNNLLKQKVTVKIENDNDIKISEYSVEEIEVLPKINPNEKQKEEKKVVEKKIDKEEKDNINNEDKSNNKKTNKFNKKKKYNGNKNK